MCSLFIFIKLLKFNSQNKVRQLFIGNNIITPINCYAKTWISIHIENTLVFLPPSPNWLLPVLSDMTSNLCEKQGAVLGGGIGRGTKLVVLHLRN